MWLFLEIIYKFMDVPGLPGDIPAAVRGIISAVSI